MTDRISMREVGPRDGLQMVAEFLPTDRKIAWIRAALDVGCGEVEATSFVPPHIIAQFADADGVIAGLAGSGGIPTGVSALVMNLKGAERAFAAGVTRINYVVSASHAHSLANVRRTPDEAVAVFREIAAARDALGLSGRVHFSCGVATAFGCSIQGHVPPDEVLRLVSAIAAAGADEILIADTVGYANPVQVAALFTTIAVVADATPLRAHFHDTLGMGLANVLAAVNVGVRRFDASLAGLGGCPFAPGATGNINLEDTVLMLHAMGHDTGIDLERLLAVRAKVAGWLGRERLTGSLARAGIPRIYANRAG